MPPPERRGGEICYHPLTNKEVTKELLYCDAVVRSCNSQIQELEEIAFQDGHGFWEMALKIGLVVGSLTAIGVGAAYQSDFVAGAGVGGVVSSVLIW